MSFQDNLEAAEAKLAQAQKDAAEWERRFHDAVSDVKRADDRAAKAEQRAELAEREAREAGNRASDALKRAEHATVLEQRANDEHDRAEQNFEKLWRTDAKLAETKDALKAARKEARDLAETLARREEEFAAAAEILEAVRQRQAADAVLAKASN